MCTVTFFPLQGSGFILTSNRDERLSRSDVLPPASYSFGNERLYFPRDQESSGTWIACSSLKKTFCLLNGAFECHTSEPPYRKSRGLVLLELIQADDARWYLENEGLSGIEPFTLVMVSEIEGNVMLEELRWDGKSYVLKELNPRIPQIWSSVTLYSREIQQTREDWFHHWLKENPMPVQNDLLHFHRFGGRGDRENDLLMKRQNDRQTISITSVLSDKGRIEMCYEDLIREWKHRIQVR